MKNVSYTLASQKQNIQPQYYCRSKKKKTLKPENLAVKKRHSPLNMQPVPRQTSYNKRIISG